MAIFRFAAATISRAKGYSSVAAAAYRARADLGDERTGQRHDYTRAHGGNDLVFAGIFAPKDAPAWARDRESLWNRVEAAEKRMDAQLARDFTIALPHELTDEQNRYLLQDFLKEQFTRRGYVADAAIHRAHADGDERNTHAHVMVTMRTLEGQEFAKTKDRSLNSKAQLGQWREAWAKHANHHLERHGHTVRIDHRTLAEQGIDREPTVHLGKAASAMERRGIPTLRGDINREVLARTAETQVRRDRVVDIELPETVDLSRQINRGGRKAASVTMRGAEGLTKAAGGILEGIDNFLFGSTKAPQPAPKQTRARPGRSGNEAADRFTYTARMARPEEAVQSTDFHARKDTYTLGVRPELVEAMRRKIEQAKAREHDAERERDR